MNNIEDIITRNPQETEAEAEDIKLWMPSELSPTKRSSRCTNNIATIEEQLRAAQCRDSLAKI